MKKYFFFLIMILMSGAATASEYCWGESGCLRLSGVGHGFVMSDDTLPLPQRQLLAIRAAKLDALRSLAEQLKGVHLTALSHVVDAQPHLDVITTRQQTLLQGVRYVSVEPIEGGFYRAVVEIDVFPLIEQGSR